MVYNSALADLEMTLTFHHQNGSLSSFTRCNNELDGKYIKHVDSHDRATADGTKY